MHTSFNSNIIPSYLAYEHFTSLSYAEQNVRSVQCNGDSWILETWKTTIATQILWLFFFL